LVAGNVVENISVKYSKYFFENLNILLKDNFMRKPIGLQDLNITVLI